MSWLLLVALACSNHGGPGTPEPAPTEAPAPATDAQEAEGGTDADATAEADGGADADAGTEADQATCLEECMQRNMARAVAPEIIEQDCREACTPEHTVRTAKDLELRLGERVIAVGVYRRQLHHGHGPEPYMGTALVLSDGTPLWITTGDPPHGWGDLLDRRIRVEGRVASGPDNDPGTWLEDVGGPQPVAADKPTLEAPR